MKEQKKREKKYNNGFFWWLIIEYLRVFISILIRYHVGWLYYLRRNILMDVANGRTSWMGTSELLLEALRPAMIAERLNPKPNALGCNKKVRTTRQQ